MWDTILRRVIWVAPPSLAVASGVRARYWATDEHSGVLAIWWLGIWQTMRRGGHWMALTSNSIAQTSSNYN